MDFQLGGELIQSIKRLPYKVWYALAEFIDNSTQSYTNNKTLMDEVFQSEKTILTVSIEYDSINRVLTIEDNSVGMSFDELQNAVTMGKPPQDTDGRSKYGMGLKTASFWLGNVWTVKTKKYGEDTAHFITVDINRISNNNFDLNYRSHEEERDRHYTIITIYDLLRNFSGNRTIGKTVDYLRSMYRVDLSENSLRLIFKGKELIWDKDELIKKLEKSNTGEPIMQRFEFSIGSKRIIGWAGILDRGSRNDAGFSILQHDRVIVGWPDSYRPGSLFGYQEGGSNTLINQRLVGELYMDDFDVSHTKDNILFEHDEEENLDLMLKEYLAPLKVYALKSKIKDKSYEDDNIVLDEAILVIQEEIASPQIESFIFSYEIPPAELIELNNSSVIENVKKRVEPTFIVTINNRLIVSLYIRNDMSPNDPYVLIEATLEETKLIVIVNTSHPYWQQLQKSEVILHYLRHCVYDGVAQWKAYYQADSVQPETITWLKDNLLRVPFRMELNK